MDDDYYLGDSYEVEESKVAKWFTYFFRRRKLAYIGSMVITALLAWWANNWFAPVFFALIYFLAVKVIVARQDPGTTFVLESRMQGEIIKHCTYYQKPILVPATSVRLHVVPNQRKKDMIYYGDPTQPAQMTNLMLVDYYEALPNGDIIMVFPEDVNHSNYSEMARLNPDLADAMSEVGEKRMANESLRDLMIDQYHEGKVSAQQFRAIMMDVEVLEKKLSNSAAARRNLHLINKEKIPRLHKAFLMMQQQLPQLAMAEASKFLHVAFDHPFSREATMKIDQMMHLGEDIAYDERIQQLVNAGAERDSDKPGKPVLDAYRVA